MKLSVRIEKSKNIKEQSKHDFSERPEYADKTRKHLNKTILGGSFSEIKKKMKLQSESIIQRYNENAKNRRDAVSEPADKRKVRSWRESTATHKTAIITFDNEFHKNQDNINREDLDKCASNFIEDFCKKKGCEVTYLVRHDDESTAHYHATFTNLDYETLKTLRLDKKDTSELQDLAGENFKSMGINRGVKISKKLEIARVNNPVLENESEKEYEKRIYKSAGVIHRNVKQLHQDLPVELAEKQAEINALSVQLKEQKDFFKKREIELEEKIKFKENKLDKSVRNISKAEIKLSNTSDENASIKQVIEKNLGIYEKRKKNLSTELSESQAELDEIRRAVLNERKELKELKKIDIQRDIEVTYEVVTSKNVLKTETKKMSLVDPQKYKKSLKNLSEKHKLNKKRTSELDAQEQRLSRLEKTLNRDSSKLTELIESRVEEHISRNSLDIKERVLAKSKALLKNAFVEVVSAEDKLEMSNEDIEKVQDILEKQAEREVDDEFTM